MNLLAQSTSPYLLQHKDNPVHWKMWGPEALKEANTSGKPILVSVGYAACHWCHVMAHESFEDPATAALMNELFPAFTCPMTAMPSVRAMINPPARSSQPPSRSARHGCRPVGRRRRR